MEFRVSHIYMEVNGFADHLARECSSILVPSWWSFVPDFVVYLFFLF